MLALSSSKYLLHLEYDRIRYVHDKLFAHFCQPRGEHPQGSNPAKIDPDLEVHMVALPDNPKLVGQDYRAKCPLNFNCHFHKGPQVKVENMDQYDVIVGRGPPGMQQLRK